MSDGSSMYSWVSLEYIEIIGEKKLMLDLSLWRTYMLLLVCFLSLTCIIIGWPSCNMHKLLLVYCIQDSLVYGNCFVYYMVMNFIFEHTSCKIMPLLILYDVYIDSVTGVADCWWWCWYLGLSGLPHALPPARQSQVQLLQSFIFFFLFGMNI